MKKNYQKPKTQSIELEISRRILAGSHIEIGGSGVPDQTQQKQGADIWNTPN